MTFEVLFGFAHLSSSMSLQHFAHMDLAVLLLGVSRSLGKFHGRKPEKVLDGQFGLVGWWFRFQLMCDFRWMKFEAQIFLAIFVDGFSRKKQKNAITWGGWFRRS